MMLDCSLHLLARDALSVYVGKNKIKNTFGGGEKKVSENTHYSLKAEKLFDELHVCPRRRASRVFP